MANPNWKPGVSGNPKGRAPGTRNRRTQEIWDKLEARGDLDPAEFLSSIVHNEKTDASLRVTAAGLLMPYKYSKLGLEPQPAPLVYVAETVELPHPHAATVAHTLENIEHVSQLRRTGKLDQDTADRLVAEQRILRDGLIEEQKLLFAQGGPKDQTIRVLGGLPPLPGTNIDMSPEPRLATLNGVRNADGEPLPPSNPKLDAQ
jgi:hypothetical protein